MKSIIRWGTCFRPKNPKDSEKKPGFHQVGGHNQSLLIVFPECHEDSVLSFRGRELDLESTCFTDIITHVKSKLHLTKFVELLFLVLTLCKSQTSMIRIWSNNIDKFSTFKK